MPGCDDDMLDRGDFVDSDDEHEVEEASEDPERYVEGLYYPICIGEILVNQYRIEHKLGHGGFSTVWMAYDILGKTDVALKIMTPGRPGDREYEMQREIIKVVHCTSYLTLYQNTFSLRGSHGTHRVLVLPLQGPNLRDYQRQKPVANRMLAARQLLQAIKQLHDGGIIHGDLSSANIMYSLLPIDRSSATAKYQYIGRPKKMPLYPDLWKAGELVMPMQVHEVLIGDDISLGDFGLAIKSGTPVSQKLQSPLIYCAPERMHNHGPTFATDMWSYMCIFAQLYMGYNLFHGATSSLIVSSMIQALGPFPATWRGTYETGGACDDQWYDKGYERIPSMTLENKVARHRPDADPVERELVLSVLQKGLSYLPENRLTASQLLEDNSFKALMEIYRL
ncbi:hypothetical protein NW765_017573 [Fusarium oxysporum]|nr:hypothetical protein NW765_016814 [Fusarium oxysporum]KAJ4152065.1 hypothetical protein NW765_017573 [Fusarium oxysporum]KAJ4247408.1 hypothetical protein NW764_016531 [Fusarium oxysporum]